MKPRAHGLSLLVTRPGHRNRRLAKSIMKPLRPRCASMRYAGWYRAIFTVDVGFPMLNNQHAHMYVCVYIYIHTCTCTYIDIYINVHTCLYFRIIHVDMRPLADSGSSERLSCSRTGLPWSGCELGVKALNLLFFLFRRFHFSVVSLS